MTSKDVSLIHEPIVGNNLHEYSKFPHFLQSNALILLIACEVVDRTYVIWRT